MKNGKTNILLVSVAGHKNKYAIKDALQDVSIPDDLYNISNASRAGSTAEDMQDVQESIDTINNKYKGAAEELAAYYKRVIPTQPDSQRAAKDGAALEKLESLMAQERYADPEMATILGNSVDEQMMASDLRHIQHAKETIERQKYDPTTALGIIRKAQDEGTPIDAVVIVGHGFTGDAAVDSNKEFTNLLEGVPRGVPIIFVGQPEKARENYLPESAVVAERLPPLKLAMKSNDDTFTLVDGQERPVPIAGRDTFPHPEIPPIDMAPSEHLNAAEAWAKLAALINGPSHDLTGEEAESVAVALSKRIKSKYKPAHLPDHNDNETGQGRKL